MSGLVRYDPAESKSSASLSSPTTLPATRKSSRTCPWCMARAAAACPPFGPRQPTSGVENRCLSKRFGGSVVEQTLRSLREGTDRRLSGLGAGNREERSFGIPMELRFGERAHVDGHDTRANQGWSGIGLLPAPSIRRWRRTSLRISGGIKFAPIRAATDPSPSSRSFDPALAVVRHSRRKTHPVSLPSAEILRPG
jgi:hypothetical protein